MTLPSQVLSAPLLSPQRPPDSSPREAGGTGAATALCPDAGVPSALEAAAPTFLLCKPGRCPRLCSVSACPAGRASGRPPVSAHRAVRAAPPAPQRSGSGKRGEEGRLETRPTEPPEELSSPAAAGLEPPACELAPPAPPHGTAGGPVTGDGPGVVGVSPDSGPGRRGSLDRVRPPPRSPLPERGIAFCAWTT